MHLVAGDGTNGRAGTGDHRADDARAGRAVQFHDGGDIGGDLGKLPDEGRVGDNVRPDRPVPGDRHPLGRAVCTPRADGRGREEETPGVRAPR
jgi:hypothetical protein